MLMEDLEKGGDGPTVQIELPGVDTEVLADLFTLDRVLEDGAAALLPGRIVIE